MAAKGRAWASRGAAARTLALLSVCLCIACTSTNVPSPGVPSISASSSTVVSPTVSLPTLGVASPSPIAQSSGAASPLILRLDSVDAPTTPATTEIELFAAKVIVLSHGSIVIRPAWDAAGDVGQDYERITAQLVADGKAEMGLIPSRVFDRMGVMSLRPLNAPFLITSDPLRDRVITDNTIATKLLAGLTQAGLVGLALFPEGLRHPFGFQAPLLGPSDYRGKVIRSPLSATAADVFKALGATTTEDEPDPKTMAGMESGLDQDGNLGTVTGNVTFFPKINALILNEAVAARLSDDQRSILNEAATETRDETIANDQSDATEAASYCNQGNSVVLATSAQLHDLEVATASVTSQLEADPATKNLIDAIGALKTATPNQEHVAACGT